MFLIIEQLRETIKSYTVAQAVADATHLSSDQAYADKLLDQINQIRLRTALEAEMQEIFYSQLNVPASSNATGVQNQWFSKNDREYIIKRGIASLDTNTLVSLLNQGARQKVITRQNTAWQQVFSGEAFNLDGCQVPFDFAEALRFGENQALNIAIQNQTEDGYIWLHGATLKDGVTDRLIAELQSEFLNEDGSTKYLPESQIVPMTFQFPSATVGSVATDPNGAEDIFTLKNERSVLLLRVSTSVQDYRINRLTDEGKNQTICDKTEVLGVAGTMESGYTAYYDLPYPHLLRKGDRLKGEFLQGSLVTGATQTINTNTFLAFEGITL